ncbi:MAG: hypothetical protein QM736_15620 [Vicinamibacterales bacterium]
MSAGSGTAVLPESTPVRGLSAIAGAWTLMLHGDAYLQARVETASPHHRGRGVSSVNWAMLVASRQIGAGRLTLRTMLSAEPFTMPRCGYPDMLATGELCNGDSIHDRQHPHDLVMELAASYERPLTSRIRLQLYGGPVGEPALGPPAFLHRPSSDGNPVAPIGHHWLDSSHVSSGVFTVALDGRRWSVDGSLFNGREPDDRRVNLERGPFDSQSLRVSLKLSRAHVLQLSGGHLHDAEAGIGTLPRMNVNRVTASFITVQRWRNRTSAATAAWGMRWGPTNIGVTLAEQSSHAGLLEWSLIGTSDGWFARAEMVGKPAHDLHADEFAPSIFTVGKGQVGYQRRLTSSRGMTAWLGATLSAGALPPLLAPRYEGRIAPGGGIFLRVTPASSPEHAHVHALSP